MSDFLSNLLVKNKTISKSNNNKTNTPIQCLKTKFNYYSPLRTQIITSCGTLTQSTHHDANSRPSSLIRKISFFSPNTPIKLTQVIKKPIKSPKSKISLTESDRTEMLSFYVKGIATAKRFPIINHSKIIKLKRQINTNRSQTAKKRLFQIKSRNNIQEMTTETNEEIFDRENNGAYEELRQYISTIHKKNKKELLNENKKIYGADFRIGNKTSFTNDLKILDHVDYDYELLTTTNEKNYNPDIRCYNSFYTQFNLISNSPVNKRKKRNRLTTIEDTIMKFNQRTKDELYSKWKKLIIKAADQFKRCHLSLDDLYAGKYLMTVPFQEESSEDFLRAVKYNDEDNIYILLQKNKYLVHSYDYFHQTALHWAAKRNQYQIITTLITKGANYNAQDTYGRTPLHYASYYNCYESVLILLYETSSLYIVDKGGYTPVQLTNNYNIIHAFKRATLLHLIHSMGKRTTFEGNYRRGFLWYIENEIKGRRLMSKMRL